MTDDSGGWVIRSRDELIDLLTRVEVRVPAAGPAAGMVNAELFADALLGELPRLDTTAIRLLEEALHLRVNGERAPGGNENWRDWDAKTETFLRGLLPLEGSAT